MTQERQERQRCNLPQTYLYASRSFGKGNHDNNGRCKKEDVASQIIVIDLSEKRGLISRPCKANQLLTILLEWTRWPRSTTTLLAVPSVFVSIRASESPRSLLVNRAPLSPARFHAWLRQTKLLQAMQIARQDRAGFSLIERAKCLPWISALFAFRTVVEFPGRRRVALHSPRLKRFGCMHCLRKPPVGLALYANDTARHLSPAWNASNPSPRASIR